ncbi:N-acetylglutamate synthase-like GNAT family acetyltransferase [Diaminobutyricimonas aerilata]|uniref:N-acetylglutamate synthase-like GNAT family acetyltransferase n=1 Tax=Diaminobutyricimonas aerilata TaxID=1162967 RepID=A0A2M9CNN8_9MICO|nr:N-acetylglutamate synthase-like GNAT family acetyltransferase [Diaminobutyricimonas aerilata]
MSFGRAVDSDVAAITGLVRTAYQLYVPRMGREPAPMGADFAGLVAAGRVTVARAAGVVMGVMVTEPRLDHLLIGNLAVSDAVRGRGVGGALLRVAESEARELGLAELRLYTNVTMTENLEYYPRRGFREVDRRTEDGFDRVFFVRELPPA